MANGRRFSELFFRGSNSSADSRSSRADKSDEAPQYSRMPQAPPMERSGGYPEQSPSDSEYTISTASPSDERQSSYTCATSPERPSDLPSSRLEEEQNTVNFHDPLYCESTLLRLSEMLCESVRDDNPWCYSLWPDIELDYQTYDYNEHESSVVATLQLLKKAALPIDTYILAVLLIQRLAHPSLPDESVPSLSRTNGTDFYDRWFNHRLTKSKRRQQEEPREAPTKEVIIIAGLIIAQKFLHDSVYTMGTWTDLVCDEREDITTDILYITERLMVEHLKWNVWSVANPAAIKELVTKAETERLEAVDRFSKLLCFQPEREYYEDECYEGESPTPNGY